mgnify:CR=1 FL=1
MNKELEKKSIEELVALRDEINELIAQKQKEKKSELRRQFQEMAERAGLSLDDVLSPKKCYRKAKIKYRKDSNTWTGRGRKPAWVVELLEQGGKLEDCLVEEKGEE